ncbi:hypothetical protein ACFO3O_05480 [Dokdonia ponticola]|uniref:DUF4145 domain-containing protein n=1 Tax=Dokdonia ponticola TaxID=2041041 RepID=A0ABV9HT38_9FLAO
MDWYEPENIWDIYGIKSRDEFVARYVVEGKFHKNVPEDIEKSFVTVSYLLAHSYYHWPMFDEALRKSLLIMEMAVKLKTKELNIDLKLPPNKKGVVFDKKLWKLIEEICQNNELSFLQPDFDRARDIRNNRMHPDRHSFMGAMSYADVNAQLFVNVINMLFMHKEQLVKLQTKSEQLEVGLHPFKTGLFVLQFQNKKILIDGFYTFKYREFENNKLLLLYINPLTTAVKEQFIEKKYPEPLIITFNDFKISEDSIRGVDLEGKPMKIYIDDKEQNLKTYCNYYEALSKIPESDMHTFFQLNSSSALWQMEKIIYENCWNPKMIS